MFHVEQSAKTKNPQKSKFADFFIFPKKSKKTKIMLDFMIFLAPPRQKNHKVKHYFAFFMIFLEKEKIRKFAFLRIFGFCGLFHVEHWEGF